MVARPRIDVGDFGPSADAGPLVEYRGRGFLDTLCVETGWILQSED